MWIGRFGSSSSATSATWPVARPRSRSPAHGGSPNAASRSSSSARSGRSARSCTIPASTCAASIFRRSGRPRTASTAASRGVWNLEAARKMDELLRAENPAETIIHFHQWTKAFSPSVIAAARARGFHCVISLHDYFLFCPNGTYFHFPRGAPCRLRPLSGACIAANCDSRSYAFKAVRLLRHGALTRALTRPQGPAFSVISCERVRPVRGGALPAARARTSSSCRIRWTW